MAIKQRRTGTPGSEQGMGVDVGAQAGNRRPEGRNEGHLGRRTQPGYGIAPRGEANLDNLNDAETEQNTSTNTGTHQSGATSNNNQSA